MDFPANKPSSYGAIPMTMTMETSMTIFSLGHHDIRGPHLLSFGPQRFSSFLQFLEKRPSEVPNSWPHYAPNMKYPSKQTGYFWCVCTGSIHFAGPKKGGEWATRSAHPMKDLMKNVDAPRWALNWQLGKSAKHLERCHVDCDQKNGIQSIASTEESNRVYSNRTSGYQWLI